MMLCPPFRTFNHCNRPLTSSSPSISGLPHAAPHDNTEMDFSRSLAGHGWQISIRKLSLPVQYYLQHFPTPKSAGSRPLRYRRNLQRSDSQLGYLRYNIPQDQRSPNLPNIVLNQVPDVVLAARLKHVQAVAGFGGVAHDRLGRS